LAHDDFPSSTETEMNLYFGLKMTVERRARLAAKS